MIHKGQLRLQLFVFFVSIILVVVIVSCQGLIRHAIRIVRHHLVLSEKEMGGRTPVEFNVSTQNKADWKDESKMKRSFRMCTHSINSTTSDIQRMIHQNQLFGYAVVVCQHTRKTKHYRLFPSLSLFGK